MIEEVSMQMGTSPNVPFRFTQLSKLPSVCTLSPEGGQAHSSTLDDQMHYCICIRVTLGQRVGDQPAPSHVWSVLLMTDMLQNYLKEQITEAITLALGKAILFFGK